MPKPSNACDGSFDRATVAQDLYLVRGARAAAHRCEVNQAHGEIDFAGELVASLALSAGDRVCDVCCGAGDHLARFALAVAPGGHAFGIDFSEEAVSRAIARGCDARRTDACDEAALGVGLDAINCAFGVYYLQDPLRALATWARALRADGRLVVSGPALDTNAELYAFHREMTCSPPSDADRMALGYVRDVVCPLLGPVGFVETRAQRIVNRIRFDPPDFVRYWTMTSLFARSGSTLRPEDEARCRSRAPAYVTKVTDVVVARRARA